MFVPYLQGFGMGGGLIVAIGAQNAFVLRQGVRRCHYLIVPLICSLCDATLIAAGIAGIGTAVAASPFLTRMAAWGGQSFFFGTAWELFGLPFAAETLNPTLEPYCRCAL